MEEATVLEEATVVEEVMAQEVTAQRAPAEDIQAQGLKAAATLLGRLHRLMAVVEIYRHGSWLSLAAVLCTPESSCWFYATMP